MKRNLSLALLLVVATGWYASQRQEAPSPPQQPAAGAQPLQTVSLPSQPVIGVSGSRLIHSSTMQSGVTAAGQIFTPPPGAHILLKLGFRFHQLNHDGYQPEISFQIMLAEWQVDRPSPVEIWASPPQTLPSISETSKYSWQEFDVPRIELAADKQYIAWITLSDLGNPPGVSIGIPDMGPRYRTSPATDPNAVPIHTYAEGRAALFREANPDGNRDKMTAFAWEEQKPGDNLFFRMLFERTP